MRVLFLVGGWSSEREVSLKSAEPISSAMQEYGHSVTYLDPFLDFEKIIPMAQEHDVAFIHLHGAPGEDGLFQAMFEKIGFPYQGSNSSGSFLALHKAAAKTLFCKANILTPKSIFLPVAPDSNWSHSLKYPLFVKANRGGSSLNMSLVHNQQDLFIAMKAVFAGGEEVLLEELIKGQEVSCGILDEQVLPPVLIRSKGDFFDYHNKYSLDGAEEICPAPLPEETLKYIQENTLKAHKVLGLSGYSRADFILCEDGDLYLLEINTIPGMTGTSLIPREARVVGISFPMLVEKLLQLAVKNFRKENE